MTTKSIDVTYIVIIITDPLFKKGTDKILEI